MHCRRVSLTTGTLLGVCLKGFSREEKNYICVPFLETEIIEILSLGGHLELW